ncbi:hypothetical protein DFJ58DRAFT_767684 [Suillus subalutaceus]|uniref:uncharacterized protein n=1 Tax=Suillus subalutaceus TaxID=48586 RepID=UPI001B85D95A|nr:uncharacterized protein DFJ58DRAFT_767684 [Suillus subalutaceus]KAG1868377.1 hypothetical protein DFJ58DRAFT_767684 [Suillus subalutaceus]
MVGDEHNGSWKWEPIDLRPFLFERPHLSATGDNRKLFAFLPWNPTESPRAHRFHVEVAIKDVTSLVDNLSSLSCDLKALSYLHKVGWVHRDFSVGNVIWVVALQLSPTFQYI